jgi:uncharacterized protein YfdQ (DUF2303 family)
MFLMNTLTVPKIKDLVNKPNQQYDDIYATLQTKHAKQANAQAQASTEKEHAITDELSSFLNDLKKNTVSASANQANTVSFANTVSSANLMDIGGYSTY